LRPNFITKDLVCREANLLSSKRTIATVGTGGMMGRGMMRRGNQRGLIVSSLDSVSAGTLFWSQEAWVRGCYRFTLKTDPQCTARALRTYPRTVSR